MTIPRQVRAAPPALLGYTLIALLLLVRGFAYWWWWPVYFGWEYFLNF